MGLKIYNTLSGKVDKFVPQNDNKVLIYTCGPTVYDYPHVGNWAAYIYWDILIRALMVNGYEVIRTMNITDVGHLTSDADEGDDKLEKGAKRENKTAWEIAKFYMDDFLLGMKKLNLIMPKYIARATDFIPQQIDMIRTLKEKGFTYQTSDGIYFDTSKFASYSDFAKLNLKKLKAGSRIKLSKEKRNISDFAIWKFSDTKHKRDMEWPTPNDLLENTSSSSNLDGPIMGFPGWHIECSALAKNFLGNTLDIHTGGIDAIPVHHTNEIAQSESANGVKFCNYWLHNNFLKADGTKISKSLGNGFTLHDIEKNGYDMQDFRMFVLQGHYRSEGNFSFENLESAKNRLNNWKDIASIRHQIHGKFDSQDSQESGTFLSFPKAIIETVNNDLNTPDALKLIDDIFSKIQKLDLAKIDRNALVQALESIDSLLGFNLIKSTPDISDDAKQIMIERSYARANRDWQKSDELRDELSEFGIEVRDTPNECIWRHKQ